MSEISRRDLLKKGISAVAGLAMAEVGQRAAAETPMPTITLTRTPTPILDANATEIAKLRTAVAEKEKKEAEETVIAELKKKLEPPTGTPTKTSTPTFTPTPNVKATAEVSATVEATRESAHQTRVVAVEQTVTAEAKRPAEKTAEAFRTQVVEKQVDSTAVAEADALQTRIADLNTPTPTPVPPPQNRIPVVSDTLDNIKETGIPVKEVGAGVAGVAVVAALAIPRSRNKIIALSGGAARWGGGVVRGIRTRLHI